MSDYYRRPFRAVCADGIIRTASVKCHRYDGSFACDTWFSVPASIRVRGKYVTGYVTSVEATDSNPSGLEFRHHTANAAHFAIGGSN